MKPVLNADASSWRSCYTEALFQDDATMLPTLIGRAESEIVARARLLFETRAEDNTRELRALENALHMLNVLKLCLDLKKRPAALPELQSGPSTLGSGDGSQGCRASMQS